VLLLATILAISYVSNNPTPSACQLLFIIFAPRHHCWLPAAMPEQRGRGRRVTESKGERGRAKPLRLQQLDCH